MIYKNPLINFTYNSTIYNLSIPLRTAYEQKIIEIPTIIHNQTLEGRLESDYRGIHYEIELLMDYISEDIKDDITGYDIFYMFIHLIRHLQQGGKVNYYPHGATGNLPINYYRCYTDCLAREPKWENARADKIANRWRFNIVLSTKDYIIT